MTVLEYLFHKRKWYVQNVLILISSSYPRMWRSELDLSSGLSNLSNTHDNTTGATCGPESAYPVDARAINTCQWKKGVVKLRIRQFFSTFKFCFCSEYWFSGINYHGICFWIMSLNIPFGTALVYFDSLLNHYQI